MKTTKEIMENTIVKVQTQFNPKMNLDEEWFSREEIETAIDKEIADWLVTKQDSEDVLTQGWSLKFIESLNDIKNLLFGRGEEGDREVLSDVETSSSEYDTSSSSPKTKKTGGKE